MLFPNQKTSKMSDNFQWRLETGIQDSDSKSDYFVIVVLVTSNGTVYFLTLS